MCAHVVSKKSADTPPLLERGSVTHSPKSPVLQLSYRLDFNVPSIYRTRSQITLSKTLLCQKFGPLLYQSIKTLLYQKFGPLLYQSIKTLLYQKFGPLLYQSIKTLLYQKFGPLLYQSIKTLLYQKYMNIYSSVPEIKTVLKLSCTKNT